MTTRSRRPLRFFVIMVRALEGLQLPHLQLPLLPAPGTAHGVTGRGHGRAGGVY